MKLKLCRNVHNINLFKIDVLLLLLLKYFRCSLLWQLKVSIDLQIGIYIAISLQIIWQTFLGNICWVVLYQTCTFCPIWLVVMATKRPYFWKTKKNQLEMSKVHGCPVLVLWANNWPISNLATVTNIFIFKLQQTTTGRNREIIQNRC